METHSGRGEKKNNKKNPLQFEFPTKLENTSKINLK